MSDPSITPPQPPSSAEGRFSLVELRKIHQQLVENKNVDDESKNLVVEILRVIAEMVVYGDNKSELLFDFFCEKNMLQLFLEIMWTKNGCPVSVHIQILQTLSILIGCVKNDTSLYYLLSNNYINEIITFPHDFAADESLLAQFASFMKSLSLRLNVQTVQFFFIEDTGAFPLLTKAVELLNCKDPMIRISAQTTILNVYQVDEARSRAYALQDEVMNVLFEGIVMIMKDQCLVVQRYSMDFIRSTNEKESDFPRLKQSFEDVGIAIEDWLFYLQDLMGLQIEVLQQAFTSYLINNFVCPFLLENIVSLHKNITNDVYLVGRMSSMEIDSSGVVDENKRSVNLPSFTDVDKDEQNTQMMALASGSLYYLLHTIRILNSPFMRQALITAFCHPVSADSRLAALIQLNNGQEVTHEIEFNTYRSAAHFLLGSENQLVVLMLTYSYYGLIVGLCESAGLEAEALKAKAGLLESVFAIPTLGTQSVHNTVDWSLLNFPKLPSAGDDSNVTVLSDEETWKKRRHGLHMKNAIAEGSFNPEYLSLPMLSNLNRVLLNNISNPPLENEISIFCRMLANPHKYSLTAIQVTVQTIHAVSRFLHLFAKNEVAVNPSEETFGGYGTLALQYIVEQIREASRIAAKTLLTRFDSHFSEMLLILINEEIKRFQGRKWKVIFPRMMTEKLLMVPNSPKIKLGIDFEVPISQVETVRREVQHFLLFRVLLKQLLKYNIYCGKDAEFPSFDLSSLISDRDFLCVEESNLVPDHLVEGNSYDMKGKKFLDTGIVSEDDDKLNNNSTSGVAPTSSWSASMLGLMGGTSRRLSGSGSSSRAADKSGKDKDKYLFVQDPNLLLIILQRRIDGKSVFKIHSVAPLIYADAKIDLSNKHNFSIMVRSWKGVANLKKIDLDTEESADDEGNRFATKKFETYLKQPERSSIYQISLVMDTEQASALAVQHIESRRKALNAIKMEKLKTILLRWSSDLELLETD